MAQTSCPKNNRAAAGATEKSIVTAIARWLNSQPSCYVIKTHGSIYSAGQPDLLGSCQGRALALEVKRPGRRPTRLQAAILKKWRTAGAIAAVVTSVEDVRELLEGGWG